VPSAKPSTRADDSQCDREGADLYQMTGTHEPTPRLWVRGLSKRFEAVRALTAASLEIQPGSIHALVGENGAGKSTVVKIITGLEVADEGSLLLDGHEVLFASPMDARSAGVTAVYQDPKLFPHLDVAENLLMGIQPTNFRGLRVDRRAMYRQASELLARIGVNIDTHSLAVGLSAAELLFVEIARALSADVRLLILDEPTAALTPAEADQLFSVVRDLRDDGASILLITHRLEELDGLADTVTVLRDGTDVASMPMAETERAEIVQLMVGRTLAAEGRRTTGIVGEERLSVTDLTSVGTFDSVSFSIREGEIVGMAGLVGSGRSEIAQAVFGIAPYDSGTVRVDGETVLVRDPIQMVSLGVAYVPEDRDAQGLVTSFSITDNVALPLLRTLSRLGLRSRGRERGISEQYADEMAIKAPNVDTPTSSLSGGNRQKTLLAKWLATKPRVLILDEPTHGIDVGSKAEVHAIIRDLAAQGMAILMISSDLPEVLLLSDRILVIADGRLVAEIPGSDATQESVMSAAASNAKARAA
jgi:rhamnose transport system ATP-binding protein